MSDPTAWAAIWKSGGPLAVALILETLLLVTFVGAFIAFIKWNSENTVPLGVYNATCERFNRLEAWMKDISVEIARWGGRT